MSKTASKQKTRSIRKRSSKRTGTGPKSSDAAVRKSTLLSGHALNDLTATTVERGRTQREAIEFGLALVVQHDERSDAMQEFIDWSTTEFGEPTAEDHAWAESVVASS